MKVISSRKSTYSPVFSHIFKLFVHLGIPKTHSGRDKGSTAPDLTRTCNEYWMQGPDNHYDMPHVRDRLVLIYVVVIDRLYVIFEYPVHKL